MNRIVRITLLSFVTLSSIAPIYCEISSPQEEVSFEPEIINPPLLFKIAEKALYLGSGTALGTISLLTRLGWGISHLSPGAISFGNECLLLTHLCEAGARKMYAQMGKDAHQCRHALFSKEVSPAQFSWHLNCALLEKIPTASSQDKQLVQFLERHWLAKVTGFFPSVVNWICPCFNVPLQVHPETISSYARNPSTQITETYRKRVDAWKQSLPHPVHFPLILTRPASVQDFMPQTLTVHGAQDPLDSLEKVIAILPSVSTKMVLDITDLFPNDVQDAKKWQRLWQSYEEQILKSCAKHHVDSKRVICIQRVMQESIGGIRLLPYSQLSKDEIESDHRYLLEWLSLFGMSANRVELDRWPAPPLQVTQEHSPSPLFQKILSQDSFLETVRDFAQNYRSDHPQKKAHGRRYRATPPRPRKPNLSKSLASNHRESHPFCCITALFAKN